MNKYIENVIELLGIAYLVTGVWQGIEIILIGEIKPNIIDTIIAIPIVFLLHIGYKKYIKH